MLRSVKDLMGYMVVTLQGEIGRVRDLYFDSREWVIRYLLVELDGEKAGKKVLIPMANLIDEPDWESRSFGLNISREAAENSPDINTEEPVMREHEETLHEYYSLPFYWIQPAAGGPVMPGITQDKRQYSGFPSEKENGPHLHSARDVLTYYVDASDAKSGVVDDFIVDSGNWEFRFVAIRMPSGLLAKKKYLVNPAWVLDVDHINGILNFRLTKGEITESPEYDSEEAINRQYEEKTYDYHGRPK